MINSSSVDRHDPNSEILELESIDPVLASNSNIPDQQPVTTIVGLPKEEERKMKGSVIVKPLTISSTGEKFDIKVELDSLVTNLKLAEPHPPHPDPHRLSIDESLAQIAAAAPIAPDRRLLQELQVTREQIALQHSEVQSLHHYSQSQVEAIDASVLQVKELKFRTQQLARHSKNQVGKVQEMLADLEQVRTEVIAGLDKFGGYAEINSMLAQLADTRHALVIAHDRLKTGQETFYESLRSIQERTVATSHDSEQKLQQYQESIQQLTQTISVERSQLATTSMEMGHKLAELGELSTQIITMHGQVVERSQALQANITKIDLGFTELSQSVQKEKEQFYELTVETIDKTDRMQVQFADIANQVRLDREAISMLKSELKVVRHSVESEAQDQLDRVDSQYQESMTTWDEVAVRQKNLSRSTGRFATWLWLLTFAVGVIFVLLVAVLVSLR
jgi:predicted  nucleic acid-binding Zn-ribbon protein